MHIATQLVLIELQSTMLSRATILLSTIALLCQYPVTEATHVQDMPEKDAKMLKVILQDLTRHIPPSSPPTFSDDIVAAQYNLPGETSPYQHSISPDQFGVGYAVTYRFLAPEKGRVTLDLIDDEGKNIVLHIDARYDWSSSVENTLVFNDFKDGSWGSENKLTEFDFTPYKQVTITVRAEEEGFRILTDLSRRITTFPYRSGLLVESVSRIRVRSEGNQAAKDIDLGVSFYDEV